MQVEGALLQMGDIHAVMGDCELCGTGLEIRQVITVRVSVLKEAASLIGPNYQAQPMPGMS